MLWKTQTVIEVDDKVVDWSLGRGRALIGAKALRSGAAWRFGPRAQNKNSGQAKRPKPPKNTDFY